MLMGSASLGHWGIVRLLGHGHAAVHAQDLSGNVPPVLAGEVGDGGGDLPGLSEAAQRGQLPGHVLDLVGQGPGHIGLHEAGGNNIGGNGLARHLLGDALGKAQQGRLGGRVIGLAGVADDPGDGADVDDPAPFTPHHRPQGRPAGDEHRAEIDGDDLVEFRVGHPQQQVVAGDPGVVDQNVQTLVLTGDSLDHGKCGE